MKTSTTKKADSVRDVIRYLQKFKNALVVIYLDDKTIHSPLFSSHIRDIAMLHEAGLQVVIIPGARSRIDEVLKASKVEWSYCDNIRVASADAMPYIKMAAFDVSNTIMTSLAANGLTGLIGNWVRARGKGIIDGFDYGIAGEIDRLDVESLKTVLNDGFIPIFPCIGWSVTGHPYNISSVNLAQQVAIGLKADKLFYVMENGGLDADSFDYVKDEVTISESGKIAALDLEQVDLFIGTNMAMNPLPSEEKEQQLTNTYTYLNLASEACKQGVTRVHLVDGDLDGVLLSEIFSDLGSGTMIYTSNYGKIRSMERTDIPTVLGIMRPFFASGKLLPRTEQQLETACEDYVVYELDGGVHACASLHIYPDTQAEIAAVAVDENFAHMGIGPKLIEELLGRAKQKNAKSVFIMTTQAADWFERLGFEEDKIDSLPAERRAIWTPERNSKVYRLK